MTAEIKNLTDGLKYEVEEISQKAEQKDKETETRRVEMRKLDKHLDHKDPRKKRERRGEKKSSTK